MFLIARRQVLGAMTALLVLMVGCASVPLLRPEPSEVSSPIGVKVALKVETNALRLEVFNQTAEPLHFMQSAIKLLQDKQFFSPLAAPRLQVLPPGTSMPLRMDLIFDGTNLAAFEGATLLVDTALSQGGQRIPLPPFKLTRNADADTGNEGPHVSILAGYGFNYFYQTPVHGSFFEMRFGGHVSAVELSLRTRVQIGRSAGGQSIISETVSFGLLGRVSPRVRFGFELSAVPLSWIFVERRSWFVRDAIFDAAPEVRVDLWHSATQVLYLTARPGFRIALGSHPAFISPNILVGIGYGYEHITQKRRGR